METRTANFYEAIVESAPDAMIVVDSEGRITIANAQAEQLFGYERSEMIGEMVEMLVPDAVKNAHVKERESYVSRPKPRMMGAGRELYGRRKDGDRFPAEISLSPVSDGDNWFISTAIREISARKKLEHELVTARQEAERANKANSAFLAAASHDLRQPVQALSLLSGALRRTVTDEKALQMIEVQKQSLTAMTNLLNSLLDISRLDAGAIAPSISVFSVDKVFEQFRAEFSRQARSKGLQFHCSTPPLSIESDPHLLGEIIQNLVSNAIRYTDEGDVTLQARGDDTACVISVIDTGIGIHEGQLQEIFKEFHQCHRSSSRKEGFGLGLAIVRRLADLLGHTITVTSKVGSGSVFSVTVPLVETAVAPESEQSNVPIQDVVAGNVLLIEDDGQVANALCMLLDSVGLTVTTAVSAEEAMEAVVTQSFRPDLIVSDYHLVGEKTGVDAITELRQQLATQVPAIVVSGDTSDLMDEIRQQPACTAMSKPVDPETLLNLASDYIARSQQATSD